MDYAALVSEIRRLALDAGAAILEVYNRDDFEVRSKSDSSPITEADELADGIISAGLRAAFPDIPVVTEEQAESHGISAPVFFLVDPLDGTKEFVQRRGDFTVNIALIEAGVPTRGVVYAPAQGRLFYTDSAGHSQEEAGPQDPAEVGALTPLVVGTPDPAALVVVASKSSETPDNHLSTRASVDSPPSGAAVKGATESVAAFMTRLWPS
jgi:3'(2'), 5'-bisphosphate nucleotidase